MTTAASARYDVPCSFCGAKAFEPCRSIKTRRVTDTHSARIHDYYSLRSLVYPSLRLRA